MVPPCSAEVVGGDPVLVAALARVGAGHRQPRAARHCGWESAAGVPDLGAGSQDGDGK